MSLELRPRLPLLGVALAAVAGILLADRWPVGLSAALIFICGLGAALCYSPRTWGAWLLTGAAFATLHTLEHHRGPARLLESTLGTRPSVVRATGIVWSEPEKPHTWSRHTTCRFLLQLEDAEQDGLRRQTAAQVLVRWAGPIPAHGDRISLLGSLRRVDPTRNPGEFDAAGYQRRKGVWQELRSRYAEDCRILSHGHAPWLHRVAAASQRWICRCLEQDLQGEPEVTSLIESMVLGARGETPDEIRDLFQRTGTMHLFAVSGLNVMMLAALAWFLLKPLRVSRRAAVLLLIPLLALYAVITGLSASCVRACLTASFLLAGYVLDRRPPAVNSVAASALVILAWDTNQLFSTGFQFTYIIVLALLLGATRLRAPMLTWARPDPFLPRTLWTWRQRSGAWGGGLLSNSLAVTAIGWSSSLFFSVGYFHLFSPGALVANLVAVPVAFGILTVGVGALLAAPFSTSLAALFNNANWFLAKFLIGWLEIADGMPGSSRYLQPEVLAAPCAFTVLDVGTGGAIHLRCGGQDWLFDCGHSYEYERIVRPYLHTRGVNALDGFLLTHGDTQHLGAATTAWREFRPPLLLDSALKDRSSARKAIQSLLADRGAPKRTVWRGEALALGPEATLTVLYPPLGLFRSTADDKALVVRVEAAGRRALFMSDSGFATEQWLLRHEPDLQADVLVKGQHARDLSGTPDFLLKVHPQYLISSQPEMAAAPEAHAAWLRMAEAQGICVLPQERTGAVEVQMQRRGVVAVPYLTDVTLRKRAR